MITDEFEGWLHTKDCAKILGVHRYTIIRYIKNGTLKAVRVGRWYRVSADSFKAYLDGIGYKQEVKSTE